MPRILSHNAQRHSGPQPRGDWSYTHRLRQGEGWHRTEIYQGRSVINICFDPPPKPPPPLKFLLKFDDKYLLSIISSCFYDKVYNTQYTLHKIYILLKELEVISDIDNENKTYFTG